MKFERYLIKDRYYLSELISSGQFCNAFWADDACTRTRVVLKFFSNSLDMFGREITTLRNCAEIKGLPRLIDEGSHDGAFYIITDYRGVDLMDCLLRKNWVVRKEALWFVAGRVIEILEGLHTRGYLHLSIQPDNILVDESGSEVTIIDLGLSKQFLLDRSEYSLDRLRLEHPSTLFCSSAQLKNQVLTEKSDLESLAYSLAFLEKGTLPWAKHCTGDKQHLDKSVEMREGVQRSEFWRTVSEPVKKLMEYVRREDVAAPLDYQSLREMFRTDVTSVSFQPRPKYPDPCLVPCFPILNQRSERRSVSFLPNPSDPLPAHPPADFRSTQKSFSCRNVFSTGSRRESRDETVSNKALPSISEELRVKIRLLKGETHPRG